MGKPVVYFEIAGRDGEALMGFFGNLFDWKIGRHAPAGNYWYIENVKGGIPGAIMQMTEDMPPAYVSIYIQVDDVQACLDKAKSLGGKTIVPPTPVSRVVWDTSVCLSALPETTSVCIRAESLLLWRGFRWDNL